MTECKSVVEITSGVVVRCVLGRGHAGWCRVRVLSPQRQTRLPGDAIMATFTPPADGPPLKPGAAAYVGERLRWTFGWIAEDDEMFAGQRIWLPEHVAPDLGWVPECDLSDIEEINP